MQVVDILNDKKDATVAEVKEDATIVEVKKDESIVGPDTNLIGVRQTSISLEANIYIQNVKKYNIYIFYMRWGLSSDYRLLFLLVVVLIRNTKKIIYILFIIC